MLVARVMNPASGSWSRLVLESCRLMLVACRLMLVTFCLTLAACDFPFPSLLAGTASRASGIVRKILGV